MESDSGSDSMSDSINISEMSRERLFGYASQSRKISSFSRAVKKEKQRMTDLWKSVVAIDSLLCDVKIGVKKDNGERVWIGANKTRLKEQSTFFTALFRDPLGLEEQCQELELDGVSDMAMRAIIAVSFEQLDSVTLDKFTLPQYLYASLKYGVQILLDCCKETAEAWAVVHETDPRFNDCFAVMIELHRLGMTKYAAELMEQTKVFSSTKRIKHVFRSEAVLEFPFDMFVTLLKQDSLNMDENEIWKRCIEWASAQCEIVTDEGISVDSDHGLSGISDLMVDDPGLLALMNDDGMDSDSGDSNAAVKNLKVKKLDEPKQQQREAEDEDVKKEEDESKRHSLSDEDEDDKFEEGPTVAGLLRRLKPFIRFTRMNWNQIADLKGWESVLSKDEQLQIYHCKSYPSFLFCNIDRRITMPEESEEKLSNLPHSIHYDDLIALEKRISRNLHPPPPSRFRNGRRSIDDSGPPLSRSPHWRHSPPMRDVRYRYRSPPRSPARRGRRVEERRKNYLSSMRDPPSVW